MWDWEEVLVGECTLLLSNVVLQGTTSDRWQWRFDNTGCYSVRTANYDLLTADDNNTDVAVSGLIWHRHVPLKVSILVWRLLRSRLPTKANLVAQGILAPDAQLCVVGCGVVETAQHLFVSCPIFGDLWLHVHHWVGVSGADPHDIVDHFSQFMYLACGAVTRRSFMQLLWFLYVWMLWFERNNRQFNNTDSIVTRLLEKVQIHFYW